MFSEWGLGEASPQLAQGLRRKNKPCRKGGKNNEEKRKKCAVIFKKPVSYCRFVSVLESPVFAWCSHTRGGVLGQGSVKGEAWGCL